MKVIVLYLAALFIIYLAEKEYRNRKLFLYPSLLLCPVIGVIAYAGVLLSGLCVNHEVSGEAEKKPYKEPHKMNRKKIGAVALFLLLIVLGGPRTVDGWFTGVVQYFAMLRPVTMLTVFTVVLSLGLYALLAGKLCHGNRRQVILFLVYVCLLNICGYRWSDIVEGFMLGAETIDMLVLRQVIIPLILLILLVKGTDRPLSEELLMKEEVEAMEEVQKTQEKQKKGIGRFINVKTLTLALIIFALLTAFSVYTLNTKINNMSLYMEHMQESIDGLN